MIDFTDLISRKDLLKQITELIENAPPVVAEKPKKQFPKSGLSEDVEQWERDNGIRKWKDRHHL